MAEALFGLGFLCLFSASAYAGVALRAHLPNEHLSGENMDAVRMMTGLLVTFAALILSLQLSSSRAAYATVVQGRWAVIEDTHAPSGHFYMAIISIWLSLVFLSFGLQIPRRRLTAIVLAIGVTCVSSVMFVIVDLDTPYGGFFGIPS